MVSRYLIYTGSDNGTHKITPEYETRILEVTSKHFENATVHRSLGLWQKSVEDSRIIEIIDFGAEHDFDARIGRLCLALKSQFGQDAILKTKEKLEAAEII